MTRSDLIGVYKRLYEKSTYGEFKRSHKVIINRIKSFKAIGIKTVFEIGCGRGFVLKNFQDAGMHASGIEPCLSVIKMNSGIAIFPYMIHECHKFVDDKTFDMVYSINVIDHLASDNDCMIAITESMRMAKKLVIHIVNGDCRLQTIKKNGFEWEQILKSFGTTTRVEDRSTAGVLLSIKI